MGQSAFKQQAEKLLSIMNDQIILDTYVNMFSDLTSESEVSPDDLRELYMTCYKIAMESEPTSCPYIYSAVEAVIVSCVSI